MVPEKYVDMATSGNLQMWLEGVEAYLDEAQPGMRRCMKWARELKEEPNASGLSGLMTDVRWQDGSQLYNFFVTITDPPVRGK